MRRGTTPALTFKAKNIDGAIEELWFILAQDNIKAVKTLSKNEVFIFGNDISTSFTQTDTLKFKPGLVALQLRVLYTDGSTDATKIIYTPMLDVIKEGII